MIYNLDNSLLFEPVAPFEFEKENPQEVFDNLKETMIHERGLGLSANQVGLNMAAFVFGNPLEPNSIEVMFNPKIVHFSIERNEDFEGCLSFKKLYVPVTRSFEIRVRFQNLTGETKTATFDGMTARIIQHECDHLAGKLYTDDLSRLKLTRAIDKSRKKYKTNYVIRDLQKA